jgi:Tol biopolymer transport system component
MNSRAIKRGLRGMLAFVILALQIGIVPGSMRFALAAPGDTTRASVDSSGTQGNDRSSHPSISGNGRYVAFASDSSNLVAGDTNGGSDVFVYDRQTGVTTLESVASGGSAGSGSGDSGSISADGRYVAFVSSSGGLVSGDTNGVDDIFVHDRQTGDTTRVSVDSAGVESNAISYLPNISGDGRFVAFTSEATNLVSADTNGLEDVFVHDRVTGETIRASIDSSGAESNDGSGPAVISADGQRVAFASRASNLVPGDTNGVMDIFVHDLQSGATTRVSVSSGGAEANGFSSDPAISGNGRYVAFASHSNNLAGGDTLGFDYVYVHDMQTSITTPEWTFTNGEQIVGNSSFPAISFDGRYVTFVFDDRGDGIAFFDILVRDRQTGATTHAAPSTSGGPANDSSFTPDISDDGQVIAFASLASNLVAGDTNGIQDVFVHENSDQPGAPTVLSVTRSDTNPTSAGQVSFVVTFSEVVGGVDAGDFALTTTGGITGASVQTVGGSGSTRTVMVNTGTGDGTIRLDVVDDDSIRDTAGTSLGGTGAGNGGFTTGESYTVDKNLPSVTSILLADPNPSGAASVHFTVNFSEPVTGLDVSDFVLTITGGITSAAVTDVSGSGSIYTVTAGTGNGSGTLRLDLIDNDTVVDGGSQPLGGTGAGNGTFNTGQVYTIDKGVLTVTGSRRADPDPSAADSVRFNVTFSRAVNGVDAGDFVLTTTGAITSASITSVSGSGDTYSVTVATGVGNGTIRLDVADNDSITDLTGNPLGGTGASNGNFNTGESYTINKTVIRILSETFTSNGANDGWVLESGENTNQGGTKNSNAVTFNLGDNSQDRQYRAILHFPTHYLPDNAVVTMVILSIKKQGQAGTDPFTSNGNIAIDIRGGPFGFVGPFAFSVLEASDFQAPASRDSVGMIQNNAVGGWYWSLLDETAHPIINTTGVTQFRLRFQTDDNDDLGDDYLTFFSGNHTVLAERPHLTVQYYIP